LLLRDVYGGTNVMKIPPYVEVWSGIKKKKFYLFKDERLCFIDGVFVCCEPNCKRHKGIKLSLSNGAVLTSIENNSEGYLLLAGSKRREILAERPFFFDHMGSRFFIDNIDVEVEEFSCMGVWGRELDIAMSYARNDKTVFLIGDTGTGKELMAQNIRYNSKRRSEPFVVINCASLEPKTAEAELFGSVKGAFTGSDIKTNGAFQTADGGTLLLDDIGSLPLLVQPMLLRAMELNEIKPVGSDKTKAHKTRVVATSSSTPKDLLYKWKLRKDLYYRLEECCVYLPPLDNDVEKITGLATFFAGDEIEISDAVIKKLTQHCWPGNARELRNVMQRAILFCSIDPDSHNVIKEEHLVLRDASKLLEQDPFRDHSFTYTIQDEERELIRRVLYRNSWDVSLSANELNICRVTLLSKIKEYGLLQQSN
jgi:transcriptional regulator with PAS, ATPase and Fis domain